MEILRLHPRPTNSKSAFLVDCETRIPGFELHDLTSLSRKMRIVVTALEGCPADWMAHNKSLEHSKYFMSFSCYYYRSCCYYRPHLWDSVTCSCGTLGFYSSDSQFQPKLARVFGVPLTPPEPLHCLCVNGGKSYSLSSWGEARQEDRTQRSEPLTQLLNTGLMEALVPQFLKPTMASG